MRSAPIVFIAYQSGSSADGGLESLSYILRGLSSRKLIVLTQREGRFTERWRSFGCRVEVLEVSEPRALAGAELAWYRLRRGPQLARFNRRVASIVREEGATIVHCNDPTALWYGAAGARLAGARVVLNLRDTRARSQYGYRWRLMRHLADVVVVLSNDMKREIEERVPPLTERARYGNVVAIHSAVNLERMAPPSEEERAALRAQLGIEPGAFATVYVGTFNDKKNQLTFIERAVRPILASSEDAKIYFVGDFRPEENEYARACRDALKGIEGARERVAFAGFSQTPEHWYKAADVVCLASRNEGLARAMIEGIACGTPVVSFDVSSAREVLENGPCGAVVSQGDYIGLVRAIEGLRASPERRAEYGKRGAALARELFEPEKSVARYVAVYEALERR